jgi:hypothetical protein
MVAAPAEAAAKISNGVACTKSGATTKTSLGSYKCAKNPLVKNSKLTWLSLDCVTAANDAVKAEKASIETIANFKAQIPVIDLGITAENANRAELQAKLDNANSRLPGAKTDLDAAKLKLAAAVSLTEKATATKSVADLTKAVSDWTAASRAFASLIRAKDLAIKKLESAKLTATNKPKELASNVADAKASANLICTKGF